MVLFFLLYSFYTIQIIYKTIPLTYLCGACESHFVDVWVMSNGMSCSWSISWHHIDDPSRKASLAIHRHGPDKHQQVSSEINTKNPPLNLFETSLMVPLLRRHPFYTLAAYIIHCMLFKLNKRFSFLKDRLSVCMVPFNQIMTK